MKINYKFVLSVVTLFMFFFGASVFAFAGYGEVRRVGVVILAIAAGTGLVFVTPFSLEVLYELGWLAPKQCKCRKEVH